jgi:hypothetical protein
LCSVGESFAFEQYSTSTFYGQQSLAAGGAFGVTGDCFAGARSDRGGGRLLRWRSQ